MRVSLGEAIASFRRQRRQIHNDQPWTQEDLAVAIGTDKAHINRIERNRQHPELRTLQRIADALGLSYGERCYLLGLAGYGLHATWPTPEETAAVLRRTWPLIESYPYPAAVVDTLERIWDINTVQARVYACNFGSPRREDYLARWQGHFTAEINFDPVVKERIRRLMAEPDRFLRRTVARFYWAYQQRQSDPMFEQALERLWRDPEFVELWNTVGRRDDDPAYLDHDLLVLNHPEFGRLTFNAWRSRLLWDDRFAVTPAQPADDRTAMVMARLAGRAVEVRGQPAPSGVATGAEQAPRLADVRVPPPAGRQLN